MYSGELTGLEFKVACFLDRREAVTWWYKNVVRGNAYGLQGWQRNRIYPDFIVASLQEADGEKWFVLETKGAHLADNLDTVYKAKLLDMLTHAHETQKGVDVGELIAVGDGRELTCKMIAQDSWEHDLNTLLPA